MGAHSTLNITRDRAVGYVAEHLFKATDEELERMMDALLDGRLYNCRIVSARTENDDPVL